ncbi:MAG: Re/Si-specific NAD(P)(+) transhydrogenase subunit alpha [Gammaproteobacteria bacterium]|nr:Re/Si-specific NAD(P)(+) transhydrogenase subunit alpha [Gammaproteobacteria bacterium]
MLIGIPKEPMVGETRVAATPKTVVQLLKLGYDVCVEAGAGLAANFNDQDYIDAGAVINSDTKAVYQSDLLLKVNPVQDHPDYGCSELELMKDGANLISFIAPAQNADQLKTMATRNMTVMSMESVPRISRSQSMDALSSMANIAGYRAVVESAHHFGRFFTGQITAAGKVPPAKVLIIGAGVAGLAAIGAAGSLGAIVRAFDTRPEVKEQINSMGAEFLEVDMEEESGSGDGYAKVMSKAFIEAEMALFAEQAKDVDIIITTAMIPGKPAPKLITAEMVASMASGSVIVDLAAAGGGNCELTQAGQVMTSDNGVTVIGYTDMPARLPGQASQLYGTNLVNLLKLLTPEKDGHCAVDFDDPVQRGVTVTKDGDVTWPAPPIQVAAAPTPKPEAVAAPEAPAKAAMPQGLKYGLGGAGLALIAWIAMYAPAAFLGHFTVFILSCVIGYYVVWNVSHALHTPLMSITNAVSGIIVVGALLQVGDELNLVTILALISVLIATINIAGGFFVTKRMLKMFQK